MQSFISWVVVVYDYYRQAVFVETAVQGYQTPVVGIPGYVVDVHAVEGYVFVDKFRCVPDAQRVSGQEFSFVRHELYAEDGRIF